MESPWDWVSRKTVAQMLDCSEPEVSKLVREGKLPKPFKVAGSRMARWRRLDIWNFMDQQAQQKDRQGQK